MDRCESLASRAPGWQQERVRRTLTWRAVDRMIGVALRYVLIQAHVTNLNGAAATLSWRVPPDAET